MLLPEIKEILLNLQKETKTNRRLFGKDFQNTDYVFTWPDGRPYRPDYITKEFQKVLAKNNFPHIDFMICGTAAQVFYMTKAGT